MEYGVFVSECIAAGMFLRILTYMARGMAKMLWAIGRDATV